MSNYIDLNAGVLFTDLVYCFALVNVGNLVQFPHLEARIRVGRGIPHSKDTLSLLMVQYLKDTFIKNKKLDTEQSNFVIFYCRSISINTVL
jgi:hypothetical protein